MSLADILLFVPLAIVTNTAVPFSFDPILLTFAGRHTTAAWALAVIGSACAGLGSLLDAVLLPRLIPASRGGSRRRWFCLWAGLVALTVIPFTTVRIALLRARPNPIAYGLAVAAGRLPRYLLMVRLWQLAPPAWAALPAVVLIVSGGIALWRLSKRG